jgi:hypothetical protein
LPLVVTSIEGVTYGLVSGAGAGVAEGVEEFEEFEEFEGIEGVEGGV